MFSQQPKEIAYEEICGCALRMQVYMPISIHIEEFSGVDPLSLINHKFGQPSQSLLFHLLPELVVLKKPYNLQRYKSCQYLVNFILQKLFKHNGLCNDNDGNNLLHLAIKYDLPEIAVRAISASPSLIYMENHAKKSPADIAEKMGSVFYQNLIIEAIDKPLIKIKTDCTYTFSSYKHAAKKKLVKRHQKRSRFFSDEPGLPTVVEALMKKSYCETKGQALRLENCLQLLYNHRVLRPLLTVAALRAEKNKFRLYAVKSEDVVRISPADNSRGIYRYNRSIFASGKKSSLHQTVIHELVHYVMDIVFRNKSRPYKKSDTFRKSEIKAMLTELSKAQLRSKANKKESRAFYNLKQLDRYHEGQQDVELIARIAEVYVMLDTNDANDLFCNYLQSGAYLLKSIVNAEIHSYLATRNIEQYLNIYEPPMPPSISSLDLMPLPQGL